MGGTPMLLPIGSNPFEARYPGVCAACGDPFERGTIVRYDSDDNVVCCTTTDDHTASAGHDDQIPVMPHGKTARDVCPHCYMIHASGQVECE